jgi:hypothetical protein
MDWMLLVGTSSCAAWLPIYAMQLQPTMIMIHDRDWPWHKIMGRPKRPWGFRCHDRQPHFSSSLPKRLHDQKVAAGAERQRELAKENGCSCKGDHDCCLFSCCRIWCFVRVHGMVGWKVRRMLAAIANICVTLSNPLLLVGVEWDSPSSFMHAWVESCINYN